MMEFKTLDFSNFFQLLISCLPIFIILGIVFLVVYCVKNKVRIKFKSFKGKSFRPERGDFGLFVYCGSQGSERVKHTL